MLESLGLDEAAQSVYRFVLTHHGCDEGEVGALLGVSPTRAGAYVDLLSDLRLIRRTGGRLVPSPPSTALRPLLRRCEADLLRQQEEYGATRAAAERLISDYDEACSTGVSNEWERLDGMTAITARTEALARQARIECLSLVPAGTRFVEDPEERMTLDSELLQNGASVWSVHQDSTVNDRQLVRYAEWLTAAGGQVRTSPTLPTWMIIFDRTTALLPSDQDSEECCAFQVHGAGFVTVLVALFESAWASAAPLGTDRRPVEDGPTAVERELLKLLGQGLTDEAVCKKLGLGLRTVRRMVADLMTRLDARSRFEAGANAVVRDWVRPDSRVQLARRGGCCDRPDVDDRAEAV